jgi:diguanylate cyclase (GGDEF)-like protein
MPIMNEPSSPPRILIVDDIAQNRALLKRFFERRGFEVAEAEDGSAALALVGRQPFDAVLLDVVMPGMNGFDVLKRIRATHSASVLPVIMVTAKVEGEDVALALELGANDYITKPVDFRVAAARVQSQLARLKAERCLVHNLEKLEHLNRQLEDEIAERRQSEALVHHMAHHDSLTGLANRLEFRRQLTRALNETDAAGRKVALLFIDLDQFKLINDTLGHRVGDGLLVAVGQRLKHSSRDCDLVARLGGDEFAIVQHIEERFDEARILAHRVIDAMAKSFQIEGHELSVSCSIGIACAPDDGKDPDALLACADLALYRAKADGRGRHQFFEPEMNARAQARRLLESDLREALRNGEFELHYQPFLNLRVGSITGFEALLRWNHPKRGMISPLEFISVTEETGLIVPIGRWVLREACQEAKRWPVHVKVAINLSPVQLRTGTLAMDVIDALSHAAIDPSRLELEITETVLLDDDKKTLQSLHQLRAMGVRICMDDFGTGYSSLSYLRMFPFDKIKIDRCFVSDLPRDHYSTAIIRAVINLANSVGMVTTVEGVETEDQFAYLKDEGCIEAQGFLISRPLPADSALALLAGKLARKVA